ncbi:MAG: radical SAM protein [Candidatus Omnitrophica bacterium]|nr:radical SAM protein [Candidatus Omnitrophota bacterium]MDD5552828.1 radical SAM protein [Candidatus Omnitrophota bacterium]
MSNLEKTIIDRTKSICPVCKNNIEADVVEENGSVWLKKSCVLHGSFKAKIAKYGWYYKELDRFYKLIHAGRPICNPKNTRIYLFYPTFNCGLKCKICFSDSRKVNNDMPLEEIEKMVRALREPRRNIFMLGGEPTSREDISEIIKIIIRAGHRPFLVTNGIKLGDIDYLRKLKKSGLNLVIMWVDSLSDENVYELIRGEKLLSKKLKALDSLRLLGISTGIVKVVVRGISEGGIGEIVDFAREHSFISSIVIRSYSDLGRKSFSSQGEFTIDELVEMISKETKGLITLEEFFLFQKISYVMRVFLLNRPACYIKQYIFIPKKGRGKKMREMLDLRKAADYLKEFEEIYADSPLRAKIYFMEKTLSCLTRNPGFPYSMAKQVIYPNLRDYFRLVATSFYTPYTYDMNKTQTQCYYGWLPNYNSGKPGSFCSLLIDGHSC